MNFHLPSDSDLFQGISMEDAESMLGCLSPVLKKFEKEEYVFYAGSTIHTAGLILEGAVHIIKEDLWGNKRIMETAGPGQLFGEAYACMQTEALLISVVTAERSKILFLDINRILTTCPTACAFHTRLIRNLLSVMAEKNLTLTRKLDHITQKSTREKVMAYLSFQASSQHTRTFTIPFNRQQLADYLSVERSALSAELSKMQDDGLIQYHKNEFTILL